MRDRTAAVKFVVVRLGRLVSAAFVCLFLVCQVLLFTGQSATANETAVLIIDSSNSMWGQINRRNKVVIARNALAENFKRHRDKLNLGIIAYGHRSRVSCRDIQTIRKPGKIQPRNFERAVRRLVPNGKTPIARSLNAAAALLSKTSGRRNIILLSDGLDNCGPDPCATAAALKAADAGLSIHVIAFAVHRSKLRRLSCMSKSTGGTFTSARSAKALSEAINDAFVAAATVKDVEPPAPDQLLSAADEAIDSGTSAKIAVPAVAVKTIDPAATSKTGEDGASVPPDPAAANSPTTENSAIQLAATSPPDAAATEKPEETAAEVQRSPAPETGKTETVSAAPANQILSAVSAIMTAQAGTIGRTSPAPQSTGDTRTGTVQDNAPARMLFAEADNIVTGAVPKDDPDNKLDPRQIKPDASAIPSIPDEIRPDFMISRTDVAEGKEGIKLKAQITSSTAPITREIDWRIYQIEDIKKQKWRQVAAGNTAEPSFDLPTGNYVVRSVYGSVRAAKVISIDPGKRVDATFILNAGALRVLPALAFLDAPDDTVAKHWVFGKARKKQGKRRLFSQSSTPNEVIRLNAGTYHLVSRFGDANALVETDITIKPGLLTEVEINHKAGIVTFVLESMPAGIQQDKDKTNWELKDAKGTVVVRSTGLRTAHVLAPGKYVMTADIAGKSYKSNFSIDIGEAKTVDISPK